jgi:glycosyltransferase involved in cell wall biosynthesis
MAAGATAVCTGHGGQPDIVDHEVSGYIADNDDAATLAAYVDRALAAPFDRQAQHRIVAQRFGADQIAQRYIALL